VCVFGGELCLPKTARAGDHDFARQYGCAVVEERIVEAPERIHPPDQLVAKRAYGMRCLSGSGLTGGSFVLSARAESSLGGPPSSWQIRG
jgi:hypothetical protein